jgi:polyvinyl alcohol dehydrogenase (cytochrome)
VQRHGPSGAAVWSAPTIDTRRGVLYVATGNNYSDPSTTTSDAVLALDAASGRMLWSKQLTVNDAQNIACDIPGKPMCPDADGPDADFAQPPILVTLPSGKPALVVAQKSGIAYALDPDKRGEVLWQARIAKGGKLGGSQWGSAADQRHVYIAASDLQLRAVPDSSPQGFHLEPNATAGGGLTALDLGSGRARWTAAPVLACGERKRCSPAQSAAVTVTDGVVFSPSVDGHLRAYSTTTGKVIWDFDAVREFATVDGTRGRGGSFDVGGVAVANGMVFVSSGYALWGGTPGNVLLAFSVRPGPKP